MVPKVPVFNSKPPFMSKLAQVNKATVSLANWMSSTVPQNCLLQVEGIECGQHNTQSKQSVSEKIPTTEHLYITLLHDNTDHQCSTPWEREGFSKTDSTDYCNSRDTQNPERAQLLAVPSMHKIQQIGSIRDYSKYSDKNKEWNWRQEKQSIQKDEARRNTEMKQTMLQ